MAEHAPSAGGGGKGFFIGFFVLIVFLALFSGNNKGGVFEQMMGTSTPLQGETAYTNPEQTRSIDYANHSQAQQISAPGGTPSPSPSQPPLTPQEVEAKVATIYRELDTLREDLRKARLQEPASPYKDTVKLSQGNVYDTDPDREYLVLRAESQNTTPVNISDWYFESYVTGEKAAIPQGDKLMKRWRSPIFDDIELHPGESAYLVTGESPLDASFRENMCTGYLSDEGDFYPSLMRQCPYPSDELKRFGKIDLDNDRCYNFIEQLSTCTTPDDELSSRAKIGSVCSAFVENTFNYNDCVRLHSIEPYFTRGAYWRIYLGERTELWRPKREIIRLMDENDLVVNVLEY